MPDVNANKDYSTERPEKQDVTKERLKQKHKPTKKKKPNGGIIYYKGQALTIDYKD